MRRTSKKIRELVVRKKSVASLVVAFFIVSSIGITGLLISHESQTKTDDLESLLDTLNLPQMAPYLASSGVLDGEAVGDQFGLSVKYAGDFNGDEIDDVIVGAPYNEQDGVRPNTGTAYIFLGGSGNDGDPLTPDVTITGSRDSSNFGHAVAGGGDIDDDGYDDVIVGCPDYDEQGTNLFEGRVYIFRGRDVTSHIDLDAETDAFYRLSGPGNYDNLGTSVGVAGHFNDDDFDDFIVGAPGYDQSHDQDDRVGRVYVILGDDTTPTPIAYDEDGAQINAEFGKNISYAGNIDNDEYDDIIIGAPYWEDISDDPVGRAYIFYGEVSPSSKDVSDFSVTELTGETSDDMFGHSVSFAGDIDNDGLADDVIVGAPGYDDGQESEAGRAYIFRGTISQGSSISASNAYVKLTGESAGANFGNAVSSAGNFNNDDYDDVIVGAPLNDKGGTSAGRSYIYYGSSSVDEREDLVMTGQVNSSVGEQFGFAVADAGDVNGDGYGDVITGSPYWAGDYSPNRGRARVWGDPS